MSQESSSRRSGTFVADPRCVPDMAYGDSIRETIALTEAAAPRLRRDGGELEATFLSMMQYVDDKSLLSEEATKDFLQECRDCLKGIAETNIENCRTVDAATKAAKTFGPASAEGASGDAEVVKNLEEIYTLKMAEMGHFDAQKQKHYQEVCDFLGEEPSGADDEIQVQVNSASQRSHLICPFTTTLMEDPVKNKVCGHIYSRAGIENHVKQRQRNRGACACPVPGCSNRNITLDQLETDLRTQQMVRREQRRLDHEKEQRLTQANSVDSDE